MLVLGGTGFVGPYIVSQLLRQGVHVTLFHQGRHEPQLVAEADHVHGSFEALPDHVPGLAARDPEVVVDVSPCIGKGSHGVLHFAGTARRGVVLTSMDVYRAMSVLWGTSEPDRPQPMPVSEDDELRDGDFPNLAPDLAFDNLAVEHAVAEARTSFPVTVLRCPIIYGPLDTQRRLRDYVRRMVDNRPAILLDRRLARLRLSRGYVENVAAAVVAAVSHEQAAGRTYNVGESEALSELEWVQTIGAACEWSGRVVVAQPDELPPELQVPLPAQDLYADTSRIRSELGYTEVVDRDESLRRTIAWELQQQRDEAAPDYRSEDMALGNLAP